MKSSKESVLALVQAIGGPDQHGLHDCPVRNHDAPMLQIDPEQSTPWHCYAGCSKESVQNALFARGLWPDRAAAQAEKHTPIYEPAIIDLDWRENLRQYAVTEEQVQRIEDSIPVWHNLVYSGSFHVWIAKPNGGKTALAQQLAADASAKGYEVYYFNLDASAGQIKSFREHANCHGYELLAPLSEGAGDEHVKRAFLYAVEHEDHENSLFIIDTLKKFTDPNNKSEATKFYAKCREFTRRGGTIVVLAHPKKYDIDDELIPDGTADLKNDSDIFSLLYGKHTDLTLTVTTESRPEHGGKQRGGKVEDAKFEVCKKTYTVTRIDYSDPITERQVQQRLIDDAPLIGVVREFLADGPANQSTIVQHLKDQANASARVSRKILQTYQGEFWTVAIGSCNARIYTAAPP